MSDESVKTKEAEEQEQEQAQEETQEAEPLVTSGESETYLPLTLGAGAGRREYGVRFIKAGKVRHRSGKLLDWEITPDALRQADALLESKPVFVDHAGPMGYPSLEKMAGVTFGVFYDEQDKSLMGGIRLYDSPHLEWLRVILDQIIEDEERGQPTPDIGLSLVFYGQHEQADGLRRTTEISHVESCDLVFGPAADGRVKEILSQAVASLSAERSPNAANVRPTEGNGRGRSHERPERPRENNLNQMEVRTMGDKLSKAALAAGQAGPGASPVPEPDTEETLEDAIGEVQELMQVLASDKAEKEKAMVQALGHEVAQLRQTLADRSALAQKASQHAVFGMGDAPSDAVQGYLTGRTQRERLSGIVDWLFGVPGSEMPDPQYRRADRIYWALTGDYEFHGVFRPDRVELANANTSTLSDMAVNAMNKVINAQFSVLTNWRWFERVVSVTPNDGSLHPMQWITFGGIGNLPTVTEGGSYSELSVDDVKESDSFTKKGGYVGITREMIKNSDIQRMQAVPRALAIAALRTRSAAVATLFTSNAGVGPTLGQDSKALFHTDHSNLGTTAFSATEWGVVRTAVFKHAEVNSSKVLGVFPRYALLPSDLYDTALSAFGYGEGFPTSYNIHAEDRGMGNEDPRPVPLIVPDFTDTNDWAAIVDPQVYPVVMMSYSQNPGGNSHPIPELFSVTNETGGLMFTNDTLPIKVRDEFAVGVNGPRGVYKENVA